MFENVKILGNHDKRCRNLEIYVVRMKKIVVLEKFIVLIFEQGLRRLVNCVCGVLYYLTKQPMFLF